MKKLILWSGMVFIAGILVPFLVVGISEAGPRGGEVAAANRKLLGEKIADAAGDQGIAQCLDDNRIEDAKHMLRLRLDGEILAIYQLLPDADARLGRSGTNLLRRIAAHRATVPSREYQGDLPKAGSNDTARVSEVLRRFQQPPR